jgi:hypothetical protein
VSGLAVAGWIALAFGAGAFYALGEASWFSRVNLALGALALAAAAVRAVLRARGAAAPAFRGRVALGLLGVAAVLAAGVGLERLASASRLQLDWSFERRFEVSPAVREALAELGGVEATLYFDPFDPRVRSTRLLLRTLEASGGLRFRERSLDASPEDADRFGISSSNSVVLMRGERFETVDRPSEGTLYEALYRLRDRGLGVLYVASGAGEGDLGRGDGAGFSGLAAALQTEGYRVRELVTAAAAEIPGDAAGLLVLAPKRLWLPESLAALEGYLARGGRLVAFLEPGTTSGVEAVLARWGLRSPDSLVVDPASRTAAGETPGVSILVFHYSEHPVTRGLDPARMTFFHGARPFELHKPEAEDRIGAIAYSSPRSWLAPSPGLAGAGPAPAQPEDAVPQRYPLVAAGSYTRGGGETRIVAFGDVELASNHYLRAHYNLDLVLNAVHWALAQEAAITLRPKAAVTGGLQLPFPIQNSFTMFQGIGLLLPELLLLAGAWTWARSRSA